MANEDVRSDTGEAARSLVRQLAERMGASVSARTVYGDPVERDGTTVIPVASVQYGFGGGAERERNGEEEEEGGGGGVRVVPVGFIEIRGEGARFRRISGSRWVAPLVALGAAAWLVARTLRPPKRR